MLEFPIPSSSRKWWIPFYQSDLELLRAKFNLPRVASMMLSKNSSMYTESHFQVFSSPPCLKGVDEPGRISTYTCADVTPFMFFFSTFELIRRLRN